MARRKSAESGAEQVPAERVEALVGFASGGRAIPAGTVLAGNDPVVAANRSKFVPVNATASERTTAIVQHNLSKPRRSREEQAHADAVARAARQEKWERKRAGGPHHIPWHKRVLKG